ncbi:polyprenol monophosphomannose synthase [Arthrobacter sp. GCM10027362]|uniref:polyprenol monophosphomannose synthase n=1 Tax=Arthrobacter sp. GCM10027362 TaxID=3273379 RepID=UPI00362CC591
MRVVTIIPTYNEIQSLPLTVSRLRQAVPDSDVLVVDDNSPDGTGELADRMAAEDPAIHVLHRRGKEGLGAAYVAGFKWGLERGYDALVEMDADGSHQPEELPRLVGALEQGADMVKGSRWIPGGKVVNWPLHRKLLSRGGSLYSRILLGVRIRDITGGYNAFQADTLRKIDLDSVESVGYCFQVDLTWKTLKNGFAVREVPITFVEREFGQSKMSGNIVLESILLVTKWGLSARWRALTGRTAG